MIDEGQDLFPWSKIKDQNSIVVEIPSEVRIIQTACPGISFYPVDIVNLNIIVAVCPMVRKMRMTQRDENYFSHKKYLKPNTKLNSPHE